MQQELFDLETPNKSFVSWEEYDEMIEKLTWWVKFECDEEIGAIYGLPRGGLPIAVSLSH